VKNATAIVATQNEIIEIVLMQIPLFNHLN